MVCKNYMTIKNTCIMQYIRKEKCYLWVKTCVLRGWHLPFCHFLRCAWLTTGSWLETAFKTMWWCVFFIWTLFNSINSCKNSCKYKNNFLKRRSIAYITTKFDLRIWIIFFFFLKFIKQCFNAMNRDREFVGADHGTYSKAGLREKRKIWNLGIRVTITANPLNSWVQNWVGQFYYQILQNMK